MQGPLTRGDQPMVEVYGADWCVDTQRTRRHLDRLGVAYQYINLEQDQQASCG
jgi:mycoredoxin